MANVPPKHDHEGILQMGWVPGHLHARAHPFGLLRALTEDLAVEVCVLEGKPSIRKDLFHGGRVDQMTAFVNSALLALFLGRRFPGRRRPLFVLTPRASIGVYPVSDAILPQRTHSSEEQRRLLGERYYVLAELVQPGPLHRDVTHLEVLQR